MHGVSFRQAELARLRTAEGRFLDALDESAHAQVCVVGPDTRRDLFGYGPAVGREVKINDVWFEVVGVLEPSGGASSFQGVAVGSTAREIYLPVTTAIRKLARLHAWLLELKAFCDEGGISGRIGLFRTSTSFFKTLEIRRALTELQLWKVRTWTIEYLRRDNGNLPWGREKLR